MNLAQLAMLGMRGNSRRGMFPRGMMPGGGMREYLMNDLPELPPRIVPGAPPPELPPRTVPGVPPPELPPRVVSGKGPPAMTNPGALLGGGQVVPGSGMGLMEMLNKPQSWDHEQGFYGPNVGSPARAAPPMGAKPAPMTTSPMEFESMPQIEGNVMTTMYGDLAKPAAMAGNMMRDQGALTGNPMLGGVQVEDRGSSDNVNPSSGGGGAFPTQMGAVGGLEALLQSVLGARKPTNRMMGRM